MNKEFTFAEVGVNAPVDSSFHYHIPPELRGRLQPGHLVRVAFGTSMQPGVVLRLSEASPVDDTKPVIERLDPEPVMDADGIALAEWLSARYLAPLGMCLWLMLPPGMTGQRETLVTLIKDHAVGGDPVQGKILDALRKRGPLRGAQLNRTAGERWPGAIRILEEAGIVHSEPVLAPPRVKPQVIQVAALAIHPERIPHVMRFLGKSSREADLLEAISAHISDEGAPPTISEMLALPGIGRATLDKLVRAGLVEIDGERVRLRISPDEMDAALFDLRGGEIDLRVLRVLARDEGPVDVSWIYAQTEAKLTDLKRLAEREFIRLGEKRAWRDSLQDRDFVPVAAPRLTDGQRAVWEPIKAAVHESALGQRSGGVTFLLHGVTGSGKTEIYLRAIESTLARGRRAIFLVPEIALTAQTIRRVGARFPGRIAIVHGKLKEGERYDTWSRARDGDIDVVIGTRSALFTPLPDLGLIILDEEHDSSYKQSPPIAPPYYHTRDTAEQIMRLKNGVVILGSATPDVGTSLRAERGEIAYLSLPNRIMGHRVRIAEQSRRAGVIPNYAPTGASDGEALTIPLPPVTVVDMRAELKRGNTGMFSGALADALADVLARGEQAILFLNRRGTATYVFCRDCGYVAICSRCDMPLTYHQTSSHLLCHHCGAREPVPSYCPVCRSTRIRYFGAGTQQVEQVVKEMFPEARLLRWDADTAARPEHHDLILGRFGGGEADFLIGTQMIAKGLDLPMVSLVGVVSADMGLALPDFRAGERSFQLLAQVAGRAGRGLVGGQVILQTYQPDHYAVKAAATHDYAGFYAQEIAYRRELGYPPMRAMTRLLFRYTHERKARDEAHHAAALLRQRLKALGIEQHTTLIGPTPCFFSRVDRVYRWQLLLRGPNPTAVLADMSIPRGWYIDPDPVDLL